jgi:hypothetical protein
MLHCTLVAICRANGRRKQSNLFSLTIPATSNDIRRVYAPRLVAREWLCCRETATRAVRVGPTYFYNGLLCRTTPWRNQGLPGGRYATAALEARSIIALNSAPVQAPVLTSEMVPAAAAGAWQPSIIPSTLLKIPSRTFARPGRGRLGYLLHRLEKGHVGHSRPASCARNQSRRLYCSLSCAPTIGR